MRILKYIILGLLLMGAIYLITGLNNSIVTTTYDVSNEKVSGNFKVALITDTHSCDYGENQEELIGRLKSENPDLILLGGDIVDDKMPPEKGYETIELVSKLAPTYYVSGNHEIWTKEITSIKEKISDYGVKVLDGNMESINIKGNKINIMGLDDPSAIDYKKQLESLEKLDFNEGINFLLAHRPDRFSEYEDINPDYIFSGHAHGGQWSVPMILPNGVFAPNQGLFPKYTRGVIDVEFSTLIVSRGLSRESTRIPRLHNPPEIVIIYFSNSH